MVQPGETVTFEDRREAGRRLAHRLVRYDGHGALVLGIPRGGVVVAAEVARGLGLDLDIAVACKMRAPGAPEFALGAVTAEGHVLLNPTSTGLPYTDEELDRAAATARDEARRRADALRGELAAVPVAGRLVILVDDGLATGATVRAAVEDLRRRDVEGVVVAVPVGSPDAAAIIEEEADELEILARPSGFMAVGQFYRSFPQVEDEEVRRLLAGSRAQV